MEWDSNNEIVWEKEQWGSKVHLSAYNPNEPDDADFDPNAPIGSVICTIYNPSYYESLNRLRDTSPDKRKSGEYTLIKHRIEFTGTIYSFEREHIESHNDMPDSYLPCVRIHVENLTVVSSKPIETK